MAGTAVAYALGYAGLAFVAVRTAKSEIAKFVANAVSEVFEVNTEEMQGKFLSSGEIILNNVGVKPQQIDPHTRLQGGTVDMIKFRWKWGSTVETIVKDAKFDISGARLQIVISEKITNPAEDSSPEDPAASSSSEGEENSTVAHLLDTLDLNISDLIINIGTDATIQHTATPENTHVVVEARQIQLISLGREQGPQEGDETKSPLLQRFHLDSFCAYVDSIEPKEKGDKEMGVLERHQVQWLVEPFGYRAAIKRVSGQRFDDIASGLEILGQIVKTSNQQEEQGIKLHAGTKQVQTLLRMMEIMDDPPTEKKPEPAADVAPKNRRRRSSIVEVAPAKKEEQKEGSLLILLPIPAMTLVLPNDTTLSSRNWQFRHSLDGLHTSVQGHGVGIYINQNITDKPMHHHQPQEDFHFCKVEDKVKCLVNFSTYSVTLCKDEESGGVPVVLAHFEWQEGKMKPAVEGMMQLSKLAYPDEDGDDDKEKKEEKAKTEKDNAPQSSAAASDLEDPWSVTVDGTMTFRIEGRGGGYSQTTPIGTVADDWIEASVDSPCYVSSARTDELPSKMSIQGGVIGPSSFADLTIRLGESTFSGNSVKETVLDDMHNFLYRVLGMTPQS